MRTGIALRVLIVDDTRTVRELLAFTIENDDRFSVVGCAADGAQAIRLVEENPVDAIILDLQMERMDGLTALPRLRQLCPDAVIAAHSLDGDALQRAVVLGADLSVVKGTGLDELMDALAATRERHVGSDPRQKTSAA
jgi:two-component system chemotaxis response regulator CheB